MLKVRQDLRALRRIEQVFEENNSDNPSLQLL